MFEIVILVSCLDRVDMLISNKWPILLDNLLKREYCMLNLSMSVTEISAPVFVIISLLTVNYSKLSSRVRDSTIISKLVNSHSEKWMLSKSVWLLMTVWTDSNRLAMISNTLPELVIRLKPVNEQLLICRSLALSNNGRSYSEIPYATKSMPSIEMLRGIMILPPFVTKTVLLDSLISWSSWIPQRSSVSSKV